MGQFHHIHHTKHGKGEPVILIHGTASASNSWYKQVPDLVSNGYCVYQIDLPGHGESAKPDAAQAYDAAAAYNGLLETIEGFRLDAPGTLIGHSLGGFFCLLTMLQNPGLVARSILISPYYSPSQLNPLIQKMGGFASVAGKIQDWTPELLANVLMGSGLTENPSLELQDRQRLAANFKNSSPHIYHLVQSAPDLTNRLELINTPILVIWGRRDRTLKPGSFSEMVKRLPNAHGACLENCGHLPHLRQPEDVNALMLQFLSNHPVQEGS